MSKPEGVRRILDAYFQGVRHQGAGKPKVGEVYVLFDHAEDACGHNHPCIAEAQFRGESQDADGTRRRKWYGRLVTVTETGTRATPPFVFETYQFNGRWIWGSGNAKVSTVELKEPPVEATQPVMNAKSQPSGGQMRKNSSVTASPSATNLWPSR